jgi:hypothetical protein
VKRHLIAAVLGNEIPVRVRAVLTPSLSMRGVCVRACVQSVPCAREREREGERVELGATLPLLRRGHCADTLHRLSPPTHSHPCNSSASSTFLSSLFRPSLTLLPSLPNEIACLCLLMSSSYDAGLHN